MKKKTKKPASTQTDTVAQDFWRAVVVVSLGANLVIFVTWLTWYVAMSS
jgi:hypothetical protein